MLDLRNNVLTQRILLTSYHSTPIALKLGVKVSADFRDIFEVRGLERDRRGTLHTRRTWPARASPSPMTDSTMSAASPR